jgi:GNAT superfamily N-acetyltransferase
VSDKVAGDKAAGIEAFMTDYARLTEAQLTVFESGEVGIWPTDHKGSVLPENQGDIEIGVLAADEQGTGWGRTVLKLVVALADRHGLDVFVRAHADEEDEKPESIPQPELENFYAKEGFLDVGSWDVRDMIRRPEKEPEALARGEALLSSAFAGEVLWTRKNPPAP